MINWRDYANKENDFPIIWTSSVCGDFHEAVYVKDWFRRCMEDYPHMDADIYWNGPRAVETGVYDDDQFHEDLSLWYEKWFSQFIEYSELTSDTEEV